MFDTFKDLGCNKLLDVELLHIVLYFYVPELWTFSRPFRTVTVAMPLHWALLVQGRCSHKVPDCSAQ